MFEWLFKVPYTAYADGHISLATPWSVYAGGLLAIVAILWLLFGYRTLPARRARQRVTLWILRSMLIGILLFALLRPTLTTEIDDPIPGQVAILMDGSKSMAIEDTQGASRVAMVRELFQPGEGRISKPLDTQYDVQYFQFAEHIDVIEAGDVLRADGGRSNGANALHQVLKSDSATKPAAVVLVTDGGIEATFELEEVLRDYVAAGVPIHSVGLGKTQFDTELEIAHVDLPQFVLPNDSIEANVLINQRGLAGETAKLSVEQDGVIIADRVIRLPEQRAHLRSKIQFEMNAGGTNHLTFRVSDFDGEQIIENNALARIVTVRSDKINVLHFEGEPRFEVKFIRRALANDPSIRLASLIRTAENKYLRLGVNDADELNDGFPSADEDLYAFDVVIIGSADDDLLDDDQQQRLRRFVAKRGGSLIALGGAGAFSEGGFGGSALADLLPVVLPAKGNNQARSYRQLVKLVPTEEGFAHSALRLGLIDDTTAWDALPPLTVVNPLRRPKPGATVLLNGIDATDQQPLIVMASQHYGRGRVLVFAVRDSWRWQMHPSISPQDMTHERLWQQLVRWLGRPVATRLKLTTSTRHAIVEESVAVRVATLNRNFEASRETAPVVEVTSPLGDIERLALTPDPTDTSQFSGRFIAAQAGSYDISATLADSGSSRMAIHVDNTGTEFISAERNDTLLNRIAAVTGGQSLSFDDSGGLKSLVDKTMSTRRITRQFSLLDVPALYLAILLLAFIEWTLRRRWTLA